MTTINTAVGRSQDKESLILLAIDGRQPGFSIVATPYQTAQWLDRFGAFQGLNLVMLSFWNYSCEQS